MTTKPPTTANSNLTAILYGLPWLEIISEAWKVGRKLLRGLANEGMYEVLDYESTLELHDKGGQQATFRKRKHVRYLQDHIIAYQDHAWGDGKILVNYRCHPGQPVDTYRLGYKTHVLLSLREVKNRGEEDEFNIEWDIQNGFLKPDGFWDTDITNRTRRIKIHVIFPKDRPPKRLVMVESNRGKSHMLGRDHVKRLRDGSWKVSWEKQKPRLYEHYLLKWRW